MYFKKSLCSLRIAAVSLSLKLGSFIMINVLKALDEILRGDHRFSNFY